MNLDALRQEFIDMYGGGEDFSIFFAPGRVNLIGEHTDYNGGYVFPCALNYGTYLVARKTSDQKIVLASLNEEFRASLPIEGKFIKQGKHWINYPLGVVNQMMDAGVNISGLELLYAGNIPSGAGLSSSASIELVTAKAIDTLFKKGMNMVELAKLGQRAENQFVGVNCGIMDQFAVALGEKDHALFLNCETLDYSAVPLKLDGYRIVIANTNKRRGLADSKYNERRGECEKAVEFLKKGKNIQLLGELSRDEYETHAHLIPDPIVAKRAKHVISENQRVLQAVEALKQGNLTLFGQLMNASHDSLRDDYEVTGVELDTLVEEARKIKGVLGSRMTGAGFGGCTVSLVHKDSVNEFVATVGKNYKDKTGLTPDFYDAEVGEGTRLLA